MERDQLEHVLRAAAAITRENEFVIIGSQSLLGAVPDAPADLKLSREVDIYPLHRPDLADLIDGAIGEGSHFEDTFGYYAQGVGPETAVLPRGWQDRLIRVQSDLQSAVEELQQLLARSHHIGLRSRTGGANPELVTAYRVRKMLKVALAIAYGALTRTESRGAHFREDFPRRDDAA